MAKSLKQALIEMADDVGHCQENARSLKLCIARDLTNISEQIIEVPVSELSASQIAIVIKD